jgi:predicted nuclease of restriction endonuclease-like RecB superfamily
LLTGKLIRVRYAGNGVKPVYLDSSDPMWQETAGRLLELFHGHQGRTRGELEEELDLMFGDHPAQVVFRGLTKLLEDRCDFELVADRPPEQLREQVFAAAARHRNTATVGAMLSRGISEGQNASAGPRESMPPMPPGQTNERAAEPHENTTPETNRPFDRQAVLDEVAGSLALSAEQVEQGLFADLKSEQRLLAFKDITPLQLLQRYNVALAQAVLLRSTGVVITIRGEPPQRYRQLLRIAKFHRLVCEAERAAENKFILRLDGPLSLFTATHKYGLQLALFFPTVLNCRDFELRAELAWGVQRKPKLFMLSPADGLVSQTPETGMYVPPELAMFAELFRKKIEDWDLTEETDIRTLGDGFWVPDFCLIERSSGRTIFLEVLGFWRRASVEKHLARLRQHVSEPFILAVSEQLRIDDSELEGIPAETLRFRQMPLPEEVARLARKLLI